jgi:hypothetical protein
MDLTSAANLLLSAVISTVMVIVSLPGTSVFVTLVTGLVKRFLPETISGGTIAFSINTLLWVALTVGLKYALFTADQFQNILNVAVVILTAIGGIGGTQILATRAYNYSVAQGVPVLGFQRSPTPLSIAQKAQVADVPKPAKVIAQG